MLSFKILLGLAGRRLRLVSAPLPATNLALLAAAARLTLSEVRLASLGIVLDLAQHESGSRGDRA